MAFVTLFVFGSEIYHSLLQNFFFHIWYFRQDKFMCGILIWFPCPFSTMDLNTNKVPRANTANIIPYFLISSWVLISQIWWSNFHLASVNSLSTTTNRVENNLDGFRQGITEEWPTSGSEDKACDEHHRRRLLQLARHGRLRPVDHAKVALGLILPHTILRQLFKKLDSFTNNQLKRPSFIYSCHKKLLLKIDTRYPLLTAKKIMNIMKSASLWKRIGRCRWLGAALQYMKRGMKTTLEMEKRMTMIRPHGPLPGIWIHDARQRPI